MDEKSSPLNNPIYNSTPPNQLKAILTNDGFIKIMKTTDEENIVVQVLHDRARSTETNSSKKSQQRSVEIENISNVEDNDRDDDYTLKPRETFMATICHVNFREP